MHKVKAAAHTPTSSRIPLIAAILAPIGLALATIITYLPSLSYDFQFDDIANITRYFNIRHNTIKELFFNGTRWISYWINTFHYRIGKFNPFSYRIGNLIIHTSNGLLIFFILLLALGRLPNSSFFKRNAFAIALLTSLLFLLHPVQTQTISYVIQGQLEGLATLCTLSLTLCFLAMHTTRSIITRIALGLLFFVIAFLSVGTKEITIVAPFLIMLVDWFFVAHGSVKPFIRRIWFHATNILFVVSLYVYLLKPKFFFDLFGLNMSVGNNIGNVITANPNELIKPLPFFESQFKVVLHYLAMFLWPFNISVEYDWVLVRGFFAPDCIIPFSILAFGILAIYLLLKQNSTSVIAFGALWFIFNIAPRSSIMPSPELLADYKTYQASFGWLLIIAAGLIWLVELLGTLNSTIVHRYYGKYVMLTLFACTLSIATTKRNTVWHSGVEFWANIVENAPGKARGYNNYGVELSQKLARFADAIPYFKHAISMDAGYRDPYNNLAVAYAATNQIDLAIETLHKSLKINANYPEAYNNIASFLIEKKEYDKAKQALAVALSLRSHYGKAYFNLGRIHLELGEREEALTAFRNACTKADLDNEAGFMGYAKCCILMERFDEAIFACTKALEYNPDNLDVEFNLGNAYYMLKKHDEAITVFKHLLTKTPNDAKVWYNLAETYLSMEKVGQALECFDRLKNVPGITPQLFVRIASCYEQLGDPRRAKMALNEALSKQLPDEGRKTLQNVIAKLDAQYGLA